MRLLSKDTPEGPALPGPLPRYGRSGDGSEYMLCEYRPNDIELVCQAKVKLEPSQVLDAGNQKAVSVAVRTLREVQVETGSSCVTS